MFAEGRQDVTVTITLVSRDEALDWLDKLAIIHNLAHSQDSPFVQEWADDLHAELETVLNELD